MIGFEHTCSYYRHTEAPCINEDLPRIVTPFTFLNINKGLGSFHHQFRNLIFNTYQTGWLQSINHIFSLAKYKRRGNHQKLTFLEFSNCIKHLHTIKLLPINI
jgi:hypothetical protein